MSINLVRAINAVETSDELHLGRLLILLLAVDRKTSKPNATVEGITKLAKLDFLLRYPNCLERALVALNKDSTLAKVESYERTTIEAKMIRFKYGPWDTRYRRWISLLVSKGLVYAELRGRTVHIGLTANGQQVAAIFTRDDAYNHLFNRGQVIVKTFGNFSASRIKDFVYQVFPELETMKWGEEIVL